ncbi:hypothetical protein [Rhodopirellula sp. MGV]|uniref:hypothetical protein n=1 Tax=Rhodopirellula sp. MGV TaxID=2023130 RepID=UPI000B961551|nr:hypothetical protein [Rhodopirellula sp. MGV]OYP38923.1 hypothetical protein CGZ80_01505 [Rhodopirellula sp. MGV]PNY37601.1 hypothetical protein C2E31_06470 [Rhodopirellula baltica]
MSNQITSTRILNVFPGQSEGTRLVLASECEPDGQSVLVLRQENFSPHVGWFVQSRVVMENDQATALKMTLTSNLMGSNAGSSKEPASNHVASKRTADPSSQPRLKICAAIAG